MTQDFQSQDPARIRKKPRPYVKKKVDSELVRSLASILCTMEEISQITKVSVDTLERRYAEVIKNARSEGKASLRRLQWKLANEGNPAMTIFLGKVLLNQREDDSKEMPKFNVIVNHVPKPKTPS